MSALGLPKLFTYHTNMSMTLNLSFCLSHIADNVSTSKWNKNQQQHDYFSFEKK